MLLSPHDLHLSMLTGRLFTIFSTSLNNVSIWKSLKIQSLIIANIASLTVWIILSHYPPMCGEEGGLNNHWIFWWAILLPTLLWSNFDVSISSSLTAPLKFVPQSETISDGRPLQLMNLCIALMKLSVSNDSANSICTATPDLQNGGLPCATLNESKVLMKGSFALAFLCLHTIHLLPICLTDTLPLMTQNLCLIADNTYPVPKWDFPWYCQISSCNTWCFFCWTMDVDFW